MSVSTLAQKGVDLEAVSHRLEEKREYQRGHWASKGVDSRWAQWWIVMSHIGWRGEQTTIYKCIVCEECKEDNRTKLFVLIFFLKK